MAPHAKAPTFQRAVFEALWRRGPDGGTFTFAGFQVRSFERILQPMAPTSKAGPLFARAPVRAKPRHSTFRPSTAIAAELGDGLRSQGHRSLSSQCAPRRSLREAIAEAGKLAELLNAEAGGRSRSAPCSATFPPPTSVRPRR